MRLYRPLYYFVFVLLWLQSQPSLAAGIGEAQASMRPVNEIPRQFFVFSAPPRETEAEGKAIYRPIAELLMRATGREFIYRHPGNWLTYQKDMTEGNYDLIFDGPHFVSWRIQQIGHTPLLKLPQQHIWMVITRAKETRVKELSDLAGRKVCVHAPPNFGTLTLLSLFPNPARQPYMINIRGWKNAYNGVIEGKCEGAILPITHYKKLDPETKHTRLLHQHTPYPNQAFTAGPRLDPKMREVIVKALMSDRGKQATANLRKRFCKDKDIVPASNEEHKDIALVLKDYIGFEF